MDGLKPCPFCGSDNVQAGGDDKVVGVWCHNCGATGPNGYLTINGEHDLNNRAAINVKPLDWQHFDAWTWWAKTPSAIYRVNERDGYWRLSAQVRGDEFCPDEMHGNSEAEAKAAAETYHRAMILEALE